MKPKITGGVSAGNKRASSGAASTALGSRLGQEEPHTGDDGICLGIASCSGSSAPLSDKEIRGHSGSVSSEPRKAILDMKRMRIDSVARHDMVQ
jgi:hypothetical protein